MWDCFISYRRDEVTFVNSLYMHLKKRNFNPWLDFRKLLPGKKWDAQIDAAIFASPIFLLVVSSNSLNNNSGQVKREWELAVQNSKRVVLLIFEATPFPDGWKSSGGTVNLEESFLTSEWIDFRIAFSQALDQLTHLLRSTTTRPASPPPQTGFKMPPTPTWMYRLSRLNEFMFGASIVISLIFLLIWISNAELSQSVMELFQQPPELMALQPDLFLRFLLLGNVIGSIVSIAVIGAFMLIALLKFITRWLGIEYQSVKFPYSPISIKDRSFSYTSVRTTLLYLFILPVWSILVPSLPTILLLVVAVSACIMIFMLPREGMYRWAKEEGIRLSGSKKLLKSSVIIFCIFALFVVALVPVRFQGLACISSIIILIAIYLFKYLQVRRAKSESPINFAVDYDPRDGYIAYRLIKRMKAFGHSYVKPDVAEMVFVLHSDCKWSYSYDPDTDSRTIIPMFIQTPQTSVVSGQKIFQMQGLDLRADVDFRINTIAKYINDPEEMITHLGPVPLRTRFVKPSLVDFAGYMLALGIIAPIFTLLLTILTVAVSQGRQTFEINFLGVIAVLIYVPLALRMITMLQQRSGTYGEFSRNFLLILILGLFAGGGGAFILIFLAAFNDGLKLWLLNDSSRYLPTPEKMNRKSFLTFLSSI